MEEKLYKYPMALTQQFRHCGNPFRIDTYKGCDYGCKYCFANGRGGNYFNKFQVTDFNVIENNFKKAFDEPEKQFKNITIEMLRHKVPLHLGGMSDPFQKREKEYKNTFKLIQLTKKYNYPMIISTKTDNIPSDYFEYLDCNIHAFQISLMSLNEKYIRKFEANTPSPKLRVKLILELKKRGFWVGVRLQPLVDFNEAKYLVEKLSGYVDYITIEHIKIGNDNSNKKQLFKMFNLDPKDFVSCGREYELKTEIKENNIKKIKEISKCPIGCGDNDLHELSDSNNCCGVDTINENFNEWIKYNSMYINRTKDNTKWCPISNCSACFNSESRIKGYGFKEYVDEYINNPPKSKRCNLIIN